MYFDIVLNIMCILFFIFDLIYSIKTTLRKFEKNEELFVNFGYYILSIIGCTFAIMYVTQVVRIILGAITFVSMHILVKYLYKQNRIKNEDDWKLQSSYITQLNTMSRKSEILFLIWVIAVVVDVFT